MKVVVMGQGYVGLPLAVRAAEVGHQVLGYDPDMSKVDKLWAGESYIEDVSSERLQTVLNGTYQPTEHHELLADFEMAIITVPTPLHNGSPDMSYVREAVSLLGRYLLPGKTIVLESTTYPGTTEELVAEILLDISGLQPEVDYNLGFSPERIDPGNPLFDFQNTPKLVSGVGPKSLAVISGFYQEICDEVVEVSSPKVAELAKILENTYRHVNIALVNEMSFFARAMDIDMHEVVNAAATKPFGFMPFWPGPGVGGHCLPIDPAYMAWRVKTELGQQFRFVELADDVNHQMPNFVIQRATEELNEQSKSVKGSRILVLGKAYKSGTSDTRESPALRIIELLESRGAKVEVEDPHVEGCDRTFNYPSYDLVILVTNHNEFPYKLIGEQAQLVLDCRHEMSQAANIRYL